jgi:hypothetical protein
MCPRNLSEIIQPSTLPYSLPTLAHGLNQLSPLFHYCRRLDHSIIEKDRSTNIKDNLLFPDEGEGADGNDHGDLRETMTTTMSIRAAMKRPRSIEAIRTQTAGFDVIL